MTSMGRPEGDCGVQAARVWRRVGELPSGKVGCRDRRWYGLELQCHDAGRDVARLELVGLSDLLRSRTGFHGDRGKWPEQRQRDAARALGHHLRKCLRPARPRRDPRGLRVEAWVAKVRGFLALSGGCHDDACCPAEGFPVWWGRSRCLSEVKPCHGQACEGWGGEQGQ